MRSAATLGTPPAGVKRVRSRLARAASITARAGLLLTLLGALSLLLSGAGSRWDWWDFRTGFAIFRWTLYGGLGAVVVALAGLVLALLARANNTALLSIGTLVLLAAVAVVPVSHLRAAGRVPPIHDITTDLDDPPRVRGGAPAPAGRAEYRGARRRRPRGPAARGLSRPRARALPRAAGPRCSRARWTSRAGSAGRSWPPSPRRGGSRPPTAPAGSASATTWWCACGPTARAVAWTCARSRAWGAATSAPTRAGSARSWTRCGRGL